MQIYVEHWGEGGNDLAKLIIFRYLGGCNCNALHLLSKKSFENLSPLQ